MILASTITGNASGAQKASTSTESQKASISAAAATSSLVPPTVPGPHHAYLGGFIDPHHMATAGSRSPNTDELKALPTFDSDLTHAGAGRHLSFVQLFGGFAEPVYSSQIYQVADSGAIPVVDWACDSSQPGSDGLVASGKLDDKFIVPFAQQLAATGVPILLRWFPDPNAALGLNKKNCLGSGGAAEYVAAFQHIRTVFEQYAPNVAFVWSALTTAGGAWTSYYPGSAYVDWIGADGFYTSSSAVPADAFTSEFSSWYAAFSGDGKPMIITDTGANTTLPPASQASYIDQIGADAPKAFPAVKAIGYLDSSDIYNDSSTPPDFSFLDTGPVMGAFEALTKMSYFEPARGSATVSVSAASASVAPGTPVKLTAVLTPSDQGGSISFYDNGQVISGCSSVQVALSGVCTTSWSSPGRHTITAQYSGDAEYVPGNSAPYGITVSTSIAPSTKPRVPAVGHGYLGAWIDPQGNTTSGNASAKIRTELQDLPALNSLLQKDAQARDQTSRSLSIVHIYQSWTSPAPNWQLRQVMADGAMPMVDWFCGDSDSNVVGGVDDALIIKYAQQLASLHAPVFLRWYWEMNFTEGKTAATCLNGPASPGIAPVDGAPGYVAAFRHIWTIFQEEGATNVSFVWAPGSAGQDQDMMSFYPGSEYVDWIGVDGYWRDAKTTLDKMFGTWYSYFSSFGLPMMVTETGAASNKGPKNQYNYFSDVLNQFPSDFPLIRGFVYFDSYKTTPQADEDYTLKPGTIGLGAFEALDQSTIYQPERSPTVLNSASPSPIPVIEGQELAIDASFPAASTPADLGGSFTFTAKRTTSANYHVITGCEQVGLSLSVECDTDTLPQGPNQIAISYSGDAEFGPSVSAPITVNIGKGPVPGPSRRLQVPAKAAYLGADVRPNGGGATEELADLPSFEQSIHRSLAIVSVNQSWDGLVTDAQLDQIAATGAIPMITWNCDATNNAYAATDSAIAAGTYDAYITAYAQQLAAMPTPIFLRWGPDPNLPTSATGQFCLDSSGPHGYQAAFQHIHDLFQAAGADNVAFVWSDAQAGPQDNVNSFYPGADYVDWIADDAFLTVTPTPPATIGPDIVKTTFSEWYNRYGGYGKPLMIYTGAVAGEDQDNYLPRLAAQITEYPEVKAVVYEDAPSFIGTGQYQLAPSGMAAFASLANSPGFEPPLTPTVTSVKVSPASVSHGQPVTLTASVGLAARASPTAGANTASGSQVATSIAPDGAGGVTFFLNGKAIPECSDLLLGNGASCALSYAPVGADTFTATYSGDADFGGSLSSNAMATVDKVLYPGGPPGVLAKAIGYTFGIAGSTLQFSNGTLDFTDQPTIGSIAPLSNPLVSNRGNSPAGVTSGLSQTGAGQSGPGGSIPASSGQLAGASGNAPNSVLLLICALLAAAGGSYIVTTWTRDRRRARRSPARPTPTDS